jgi:hypothetical protein
MSGSSREELRSSKKLVLLRFVLGCSRQEDQLLYLRPKLFGSRHAVRTRAASLWFLTPLGGLVLALHPLHSMKHTYTSLRQPNRKWLSNSDILGGGRRGHSAVPWKNNTENRRIGLFLSQVTAGQGRPGAVCFSIAPSPRLPLIFKRGGVHATLLAVRTASLPAIVRLAAGRARRAPSDEAR